jgi:hypothetical protein
MHNPSLFAGDTFIAMSDAWCPDAGVAVEIESRQWHLSPAALLGQSTGQDAPVGEPAADDEDRDDRLIYRRPCPAPREAIPKS